MNRKVAQILGVIIYGTCEVVLTTGSIGLTIGSGLIDTASDVLKVTNNSAKRTVKGLKEVYTEIGKGSIKEEEESN